MTITSARLNGIPVSNGQIVELEIDDETKVEFDDGVHEIEAPAFELVVSCEDEDGNTSEATVNPVF